MTSTSILPAIPNSVLKDIAVPALVHSTFKLQSRTDNGKAPGDAGWQQTSVYVYNSGDIDATTRLVVTLRDDQKKNRYNVTFALTTDNDYSVDGIVTAVRNPMTVTFGISLPYAGRSGLNALIMVRAMVGLITSSWPEGGVPDSSYMDQLMRGAPLDF